MEKEVMKEDFTEKEGFFGSGTQGVLFLTLKLLVACILLYLMAFSVDKFGSLFYALSSAVFAFLASLSMMYTVTCAKAANLHRYNNASVFYPILSGRVIAYIVVFFISFIFSFVVVVKLYLLSGVELAILLVIVPVFALSHFVARKLSAVVYKGEYAAYSVRRISYILTAVIMAILFPLAAYYFSDMQALPSFHAIAEAAMTKASPLENNPLAYGLAYAISLSDGVTALVVFRGAEAGGIYSFLPILFFFGNGLFFYLLINFIGAFFLRFSELKAVIAPIGENKESYGANKFTAAFFAVIVFIFIYPSLFAYISLSVPVRDIIALQVNGYVKIMAEEIDGTLYRVGTIQEIAGAQAGFYASDPEELIRSINTYYDEMVLKTDDYLNWYYSLGAEYGRILKVITGNIEDYMRNKLKEKITPSNDIAVAFDSLSNNASQLVQEVNAILERNKLDSSPERYEVVTDVNLSDIYKKSEVANLVDLKERLLFAAGGGSIAGLVAGKIASKTIFKTAAKSAAKLALQKGAGAVAGVAVGALTSVFTSPVGGIALGTATGLALDKGMLKLEEAVNRNEHKREIVDSINESRRQMIEKLNLLVHQRR